MSFFFFFWASHRSGSSDSPSIESGKFTLVYRYARSRPAQWDRQHTKQIYLYMWIYICVQIYGYICGYICAYMWIYMYKYVDICVHIYIYVDIYIYLCSLFPVWLDWICWHLVHTCSGIEPELVLDCFCVSVWLHLKTETDRDRARHTLD